MMTFVLSRTSDLELRRHVPRLDEKMAACGIPAEHVEYIKWNSLKGWDYMTDFPPDCVYIADAIPFLPRLVRRVLGNKVKIVSTAGDRFVHVLLERWPFTSRLLDLAERWEVADARASDVVVSTGADCLNDLAARCGECATQFVHFPDAFEKYKRPDSVWLYQGTLRWDKGVERLIDEVARNHGVMLVVVGDGPHRYALERYAERVGAAGRVVFAGWVDNPEPFWRVADLAVVTRGKTRGNEFAEPGLKARAEANGKPVWVMNE